MKNIKNTLLSRFTHLVVVLMFVSTFAHATTISGVEKSYANKEIVFLKPADPFTGKEMELARTTFDSVGQFQLNIDFAETTYICAYLGANKIHLFAEPQKHYKLILPSFLEKTKADDMNPYFAYVEVHVGLENPERDELNLLIRMFNDSFVPFYAKHSERVFADDVEFEQLDKDIAQLDKPFAKSKNEYFNAYRKYKYGLLRFIAYQHKSKSVSDIYFKSTDFLETNPAYVELFNMVYQDYFSYFTRTENGSKLVTAIKNKSYSEVKKVLSFDEVLQPDRLLNMVLLRSFHDEFYDDNYSRSGLLTILDSLVITTDDVLVKNTALSIREKVTKLLVGYAPPAFSLYDKDSNLVSLEKFKGKFVYLNFCSCFSYSCINEFAMLQTLYKKHSKYLEIITVVIDDDVQVMKDFIERSGYNWTFLHFDNQPEIFRQYDVRAFPTYYLIDNEGVLSMSPAPAPAEEFEGRLFKALRAKGIL